MSGQEAVAEIVRAHEERDDYFAVILDWRMPDMDGLDTAREIRRRVGPDLPIIMLSGYDCSDVGADFLAAGVDVFIMKPLFKWCTCCEILRRIGNVDMPRLCSGPRSNAWTDCMSCLWKTMKSIKK